jgi:hypothetical protein
MSQEIKLNKQYKSNTTTMTFLVSRISTPESIFQSNNFSVFSGVKWQGREDDMA